MIGQSQYAARQGSHQRQFEKNRAKERDWERRLATIAATNKALAYATWENNTNDTIAHRRHRVRVAQLGKEHERELDARRQRLKDLYASESAGWEDEVLSSAETMEQRKERIRKRAMALRRARDEARSAFVQKCYDRQWRDACDDARTLDSEAMLRHVTSERRSQLADKDARREADAAAEGAHMAEIQARMAFLERREHEAEEKRAAMDASMREDLDAQVRYNAARRRQHFERQHAEEMAELADLRSLVDSDADKERRRREAAHAAGRCVLVFNESRRERAKEAADAERRQDLELIKYACEKDRAGEEEERRKREHEKTVMRQYRDYLREQMIREAQDQHAYDEVRLKAENRIWDQREAEQKARADARSALLEEVHDGRRLQIRLRQAREEQQRHAEEEQARLDRQRQQEVEEAERRNEEARRAATLENLARLRLQIRDKERQQEAAQELEKRELDELARREEDHKERLKKQAGIVLLHRPRNHAKWYS